MDRQKTCKQRVRHNLNRRIKDLKRFRKSDDLKVLELGNLYEYGLCFDYVEPDTFEDQQEGYFRYQLSYGGPSDEFRYYINPCLTPHRIEYWFLDWFDGAHIKLKDKQLELLTWLWDIAFIDLAREELRKLNVI